MATRLTYSLNKDPTPPTATVCSFGSSSIIVTFSEPVSMNAGPHGALNLSLYKASGGLLIKSARALNDRTVRLYTSKQIPGQEYTLTLTGVTDLAGNEIV